MKKFLSTLFIFLAVPMVPYVPFAKLLVPRLLEKANGPNTKTQIDHSFGHAETASPDLLILGNSRIYRGLNPEWFDIQAYNFSNDNDTYNQLYYKLKWMEERKRIKHIILGIDYFQFSVFSDEKNYAYNGYLGPDYVADYVMGKVDWKRHLEFLDPKRLTAIIPRKNIPYQKRNGQFIYPGTASESDRVTREVEMLEIQTRYFEKILTYCRQRGITVFLCMPPIRESEMREYKTEDLEKFNAYISGHLGRGVEYLDFSKDESYGLADYTDITHLNEAAADRFSKSLNDTINHRLSMRSFTGPAQATLPAK